MSLPTTLRPVIGILYPGEMGATVGRLLAGRGFQVVTTAAGRSERTTSLAGAAGLDLLPSLHDVAQQGDIVLSLVSPAAAVRVAEEYRTAVGPGQRLFVDLNSIAPDTAQHIAGLFHDSPVSFVDGAIHGLASRLPEHGTIYLSGPAAHEAALSLSEVFKVKVLDDKPGTASAFKMLIAGLNKGLSALFIEVALTARHAGLLDQLLVCFEDAYPGVMAVVKRTVPTYPQHARRRAEEMRELEDMMRRLGLQPCVTAATSTFIEALATVEFGTKGNGWSLHEVIEQLQARSFLQDPRLGQA